MFPSGSAIVMHQVVPVGAIKGLAIHVIFLSFISSKAAETLSTGINHNAVGVFAFSMDLVVAADRKLRIAEIKADTGIIRVRGHFTAF